MNTSNTTTIHNPLIAIAIFAAFVILLVVVIVLAIKRREETFEGEVIDKNIVEIATNNVPMNNVNGMGSGINIINSGGVRHDYRIKVKTSTGKTINYKISSGMYEIVKIGDTVSKAKGTTEITIVSSKSQANSDVDSKPTPSNPTGNTPSTLVN